VPTLSSFMAMASTCPGQRHLALPIGHHLAADHQSALYTVVYCTADNLLPEGRKNAKRQTTDAEIVTLVVAQVLLGLPSDRR
jgi:hypothetical protein